MIKSIFTSAIAGFMMLFFTSLSFSQPWMNGLKNNNNDFYAIKKSFSEWSAGKDLKKLKGFKNYKRWEYFWEQRVYPSGKIPDITVYWDETIKHKNNSQQKSTQTSLWASVASNVIPNCSDTLSIIGMGRINCIAFHPTDTNIIFIGASQGGVWKSPDGGANWMCLTDDLPVLRISYIAVDPVNPDIIYIATGDIDDIAFSAVQEGRPYNYGIGILKSTNGGITWNTTGLSFALSELQNTLIRKIFINPLNTNELLAAGYKGIWKSYDAGANWTYIESYRVIDMEINPLNYKTVYASTYYNAAMASSKRIYKSYDFGESWVELTTGMPTGTAIARVEITTTKADTNYLYAIACKQHGGLQGIYKSTNAGTSWTKLTGVPNVLGWADGGKLATYTGMNADTLGQGWYDLTIVADPLNKNKVFTGGVNMWGTSNGGSAWNIVSMWVKYMGNSIHADQHYSVYHPITNALYVANDGGLYKTYNPLIGSLEQFALPPPFGLGCINMQTMEFDPTCYSLPTKWFNLGHGIINTEYYRLALCRNNSNMIVAGAQDNGTFMLRNGSWLNTLGGDGMEAMVDHYNDSIIYATNYNGALSRSDDAGYVYTSGLDSAITSADAGNEQGEWVTPYIMHPDSSEVIYGGFQNVWKSSDKGTTWTKLGNDPGDPYRALAICGSNANVIYGTRGNMINKTTDGGITWSSASTGLPLGQVMNTYIAVDKINPDLVWATTSGYVDSLKVFMSNDGGATWKNISEGLPNVPVNCIVRNENSNSDIYVGTDIGVYFTNDSLQGTATKWIEFSNGLPNVIINELEIHYGSGKIRAATYGRGLWETDLFPYIPTGNNKFMQAAGRISVSPNPVKDIVTISFGYETKQDAEIVIFAMNGKKLINTREVIESKNSCNINVSKLQSGIYVIVVKSKDTFYTTKFIKQ